jgi:hypothetical protein
MAQVRVWVPAAVMRRAQALMVQGTGPASSGLSVVLRSDFYESTVPLQVRFIFAFCCRFAGIFRWRHPGAVPWRSACLGACCCSLTWHPDSV